MKVEPCYYQLTLQIHTVLEIDLDGNDDLFKAVAMELVKKPDYFWLPKGNPFYRNKTLSKYICETRGQKN